MSLLCVTDSVVHCGVVIGWTSWWFRERIPYCKQCKSHVDHKLQLYGFDSTHATYTYHLDVHKWMHSIRQWGTSVWESMGKKPCSCVQFMKKFSASHARIHISTTSHTRIRIRVTVEFISVAVSAFIYTSNASTTKDKACMGTCW